MHILRWTKSKFNSLSFHLRKLEKEKQDESKIRRKEIIKIIINAEINETENRKLIEKIDKTKNWLCEKIHKIDKPPARLAKKIKGNLLAWRMEEGTSLQSSLTLKYNKRMLWTTPCLQIRYPRWNRNSLKERRICQNLHKKK